MDPLLIKHKDLISDFGYVSVKVNEQVYGNGRSKVSDMSGIETSGNKWYGMSPSKLLDDGLIIGDFNETCGLGWTEQLYTARGAQGGGLARNEAVDNLHIQIPEDWYKTFLALEFDDYGAWYVTLRVLWTTKTGVSYMTDSSHGLMQNLPLISALVRGPIDKSFRDTLYNFLLIEMYDPTDQEAREMLIDDFYGTVNNKHVKIIDA